MPVIPRRLRHAVVAVCTVLGLASAAAGAKEDHDAQNLSAISQGSAAVRFDVWHRLLKSVGLDEWGKLIAVNRFFNQLDQQDDIKTWGVADYWASPEELLTAGAGDCEDFAIAKYVTLIAMGVARDRLRLVITRTYSLRTRRIERHMVLVYRSSEGESPWILDNLTPRIARAGAREDIAIIADADRLPVYERWLSSMGKQVAATLRISSGAAAHRDSD